MPKLNTRNMFMISVLLLLGSAVWIGFTRDQQETSTSGKIPAPAKGFLAPDFSLQTLDGGVITMSELRGKPVIINLWASWCPPCRAEMPALQNIHDEFGDQGLTILAVNATNQDDLDSAIAFVDEHQLTFPILLDTEGKVSASYQLRSLPTTFFVEASGIIQEVVVGGPMAEALLRVRVSQLLEKVQP